MPSPGDPANLKVNLATLAQLANKPKSKLGYSPRSAQFSVDEDGPLQGIIRTVYQDSVTKEEYFGKPIRELFAAARSKIGGSIQRSDFDNAIDGLKALRNSYVSDPIKLAEVNAVIEEVERGIGNDPAGNQNFRERHQRYLLYGFAQEMFLPGSNPGICYSFTVHWARRILMGKAHFGISKTYLTENPLTLNHLQKQRMMDKVDDKSNADGSIRSAGIQVMQAELRQYSSWKFGAAVMDLARGKTFSKYSQLKIGRIASEPTGDEARGSEVIKAIRLAAKRNRINASVFLVSFAPKKGKSGHTIGIHLDPVASHHVFHFFDSNFGEFNFPPESKGDRDLFLDEWWKFYSFGSWELETVT